MLKGKSCSVLVKLCVLIFAALSALPALAQAAESKEKPPMYSYVSFWTYPRAQWGEVDRSAADDRKILDKALAGGSIVAYGSDKNLVHTADGETHDDWWSSMSMSGLLGVLDQFYKAGATASPLMISSTKHWDAIFVSRHYNWHTGSWKDAYTHGSSYKLKPDAPDDAVKLLSDGAVVPLMEKLLADGTIVEYEVDVEAVHTEAPGTFYIFYITPNAEGIDKTNAALRDTLKSNRLIGPAFDSVVNFEAHRDFLARTDATYK